MGDTIFSGRWPPSIRTPTFLLTQSFSFNPPDRCHIVPRSRLGPACPSFPFHVILIAFLLCAVPDPSGFSAELSDREEEGLTGAVRSVETRDTLLLQTDRFDAHGRLAERFQDGLESAQELWPLRFLYVYDHAGRRTAEAVRDGRGELVKETRFAYDDHGNRSAEVATWGDGRFENASLYDYDHVHRRIRALHYNAVQVINRNLFTYDGRGRLVRERFERNYRSKAGGNQVMRSTRFDVGYEVTMRYDDLDHIREKVVVDLTGRPQGRSEFRYDEHGNQIEERISNADGRMTDRKAYRYRYDAAGNWIEETLDWWEISGGREALKQSHVKSRMITYY